MKQRDVFPSQWLAAEDLGTSRPVVTISKVGWAEFNDGTKKRAVWFEGKSKGLSLNVTNWNTIAEVTGRDDDDEWVGCSIRLYATRVPFQGKSVNAIRVDAAPANGNGRKASLPPPPPPDPEPDFDGGGFNTDPDVPF